jgi:alkane 1-monooxygenase
MASAAAFETPLAPGELARIWLRHLVSLYIPAASLLFLWTGPHAWYTALAFMWPMVVAHQLDCAPRFERRQPAASLPAWPFDALVYLLAALQIVIVAWTVALFTRQGIFSFDMVLVLLLVGGSSGFSIITAHELIHRKGRADQALGRLLLCSVMYEHFYTEHLRGHHVRVGTPEDPATARFGEAFEPFFRRTVPAQLRSAWQLEKRRLGDPEMRLFDRRMLRSRVLHGLALEWGVALAVLAFFGLPAFVAFLLQAFMAVRLLEAVNYFEHWGLVRRGPRVRPMDSWDTHSWFTYYGLVGLSRHADHHAWPARPYQQLRVFDEAPILPMGYVGMTDLVTARNRDFQLLAAEELGRRRLGPFTPGEADLAAAGGAPQPVPSDAALARLAEAQAAERGGRPAGALVRGWLRLPLALRAALAVAALVALTGLGVHWETGGAEMSLPARLALHAWVAVLLVGVFAGARRLRERTDHESLAFGCAFAALLVLGALTDRVVATLF